MRSQVKTKERVRQHGEVFTAEREVNAMLDLVKHEASNIVSTFLEPACGDGNFLAEILSRKLRVYSKSPEQMMLTANTGPQERSQPFTVSISCRTMWRNPENAFLTTSLPAL